MALNLKLNPVPNLGKMICFFVYKRTRTFINSYHHSYKLWPTVFPRDKQWLEYMLGYWNPHIEDCLRTLFERYDHRVHTEWQLSLYGVHSIMIKKSAQPGEGEWCSPTPFHYIYQQVQSFGVLSSWEGRYTLPIVLLYSYMYTVDMPIRMVKSSWLLVSSV